MQEEKSYLAIQGKSFKLNLGPNESGYGYMAPAPAPDDSSLQRHEQFHALITLPSSAQQ